MAKNSMMTAQDLADLPDEVRAEIERPALENSQTLRALGQTIAKLRDEAVSARKDSGIETAWLECEEAYLGIDDENRAEFDGARWAKPMSMEGPLVRRTGHSQEIRATAFVRLTSRYVDAGTAKVCEIALPIDGKSFVLKATPIPEMTMGKDDERPAQEVTGQAMPGPQGQPVTVSDLAKHALEKADDAARKASTRIYDWMVEYKHPAEMRKIVFDGARIGTGVIKGPIPEERTVRVLHRIGDRQDQDTAQAVQPTQGQGEKPSGVVIEIVKQIKPAARWIDPWCLYPAPGCREDIHNGSHIFELDPMLAGELRDLGKTREFLRDAIDQVIEDGPTRHRVESGNPKKEPHKKQFDVWHFHGKIPRKAFEAANSEQSLDLDKDADQIFAIVTIVNDTVIRAILPPLDSGRLPYHVFNWRRRAGHWAGVGVGEQVKAAQKIVNSATRAMLNNAGHSADAHVIMHANGVRPANGDMRVTPGKLWFLDESSGLDDVRKAFASFVWPNTTPQLMSVIEYGFKLAEDHSSIPLISQGQSGKTTPDTFSGQQLQDNNANQLLRDVGFGLNDTITTPLVDQFYEWLLVDPEVPDEEKGDYQVDTSGALALIEKALQDQTIIAIGSMLQNPEFRVDPARWFEQYCRAKRLSPEEFQYSDTEWEKKMSQPPPPPIPVQVAQIRAQTDVQRIKTDTDRDTAYNQSLTNRDQTQSESKQAELMLQEKIANLNYQTKLAEFALKKDISLEQAKTELAQTAMKLNVQRELSGADLNLDMHKHHNPVAKPVIAPPTEPAGRAPAGQSFQR
jgi:hypothetical protein